MTESDAPNMESGEEEAKSSPKEEGEKKSHLVKPPAKDVSPIPRRAGLTNFWRALKHINEASVAENVKQRFSDYVTIALVVLCILSLMMAVTVPVPPGVKLLPLLFTVGAVIFYIVNRLGIMISLTARQALIVWQILVAGFWLGVTSAMLVMLACFFFVQAGTGGF